MDVKMFGSMYRPDININPSVQILQTDGQSREDKRADYSTPRDLKEGADVGMIEFDIVYQTDVYPSSIQIHQTDGRPLSVQSTGPMVRSMPRLKEGTDVDMFEFDSVYQTDVYPSIQIHQTGGRPIGSIRSLL